MRTGHIKPVKDENAQTARSAAFDRKQKWKELPGNRYAPEELREMTGEFGKFTIRRLKRRVMFIP
jgi:hypothetical protein